MMKNLTLRTKAFVLISLLVFFTTGPLVAYYLWATEGIGALGTDPAIEQSLARGVDLAPDRAGKEAAAGALMKYRQIAVLKDRIIRQVLVFSTGFSVAVIVIALIAGYVLISRITKPLKDLTAATRRLAVDRPGEKLPENAGGEIGELISAFNTMSQGLQTAQEQRAIAERRATWQHVARTIAHEIKNPLTPIRLSTERMYEKFLMESPDFPEVIKSTTQTVLCEIANLQKLVDTFHRYAKFPDPVQKTESISEIIAESVALFSGGPVPVTTVIDGAMPALRLDRGQIREALTNCIKNAIESLEGTGRPPEVSVRCRVQDGAVAVTVEDNGCGISSENQKNLFQPYFTTKKQGSGIGLALIDRIVTLHGATVSVASEVDRGTTVTITFPAHSDDRTPHG